MVHRRKKKKRDFAKILNNFPYRDVQVMLQGPVVPEGPGFHPEPSLCLVLCSVVNQDKFDLFGESRTMVTICLFISFNNRKLLSPPCHKQ